MRSRWWNGLLVLSLLGFPACDDCSDGASDGSEQSSTEQAPPDAGSLPTPSKFTSIDDDKERARAIFEAIGEVLKHPRCVNCHPTGDRPRMGDESRPHQPKVVRGSGGMGKPGMRCSSCHGSKNFRNVPGRAGWRVAPESMAWEGKPLGEICRQIKDEDRNGGKTLDELVDHMANDQLVGYGWDPPDQYERLDGTQQQLGDLARAWVEAGAHCPKPVQE